MTLGMFITGVFALYMLLTAYVVVRLLVQAQRERRRRSWHREQARRARITNRNGHC